MFCWYKLRFLHVCCLWQCQVNVVWFPNPLAFSKSDGDPGQCQCKCQCWVLKRLCHLLYLRLYFFQKLDTQGSPPLSCIIVLTGIAFFFHFSTLLLQQSFWNNRFFCNYNRIWNAFCNYDIIWNVCFQVQSGDERKESVRPTTQLHKQQQQRWRVCIFAFLHLANCHLNLEFCVLHFVFFIGFAFCILCFCTLHFEFFVLSFCIFHLLCILNLVFCILPFAYLYFEQLNFELGIFILFFGKTQDSCCTLTSVVNVDSQNIQQVIAAS